jgi:hypothetical protein
MTVLFRADVLVEDGLVLLELEVAKDAYHEFNIKTLEHGLQTDTERGWYADDIDVCDCSAHSELLAIGVQNIPHSSTADSGIRSFTYVLDQDERIW